MVTFLEFPKKRKSIAICPEVKTSHLGIIKTPKNPPRPIKKPRKLKNTYIICHILGPIRPRFGHDFTSRTLLVFTRETMGSLLVINWVQEAPIGAL